MAESFRGRFRYPGWIAGGVVAIATVVMASVAVLEFLREPDARSADGPAARPSDVRSPTNSTDAGARTGSAEPTYLADLTPVSGLSRLAQLPDELTGEPGYERAVVIACPSNQTGDQISEVVYETRYRYSTLEADLRPYRDPPDDVLVNLRVYSDPQDREPGASLPGEPHLEQLRAGEARAVPGVEIGDSYYLRLRVECEKPKGYMIMVGALLHPAD